MKQKSFISERNHFVLLLPFAYAFFSRIKGLKGLAHNALTAWVPGILLVALISERTTPDATVSYVVSYLAFISIYELGYLVNDTLGTKNDETARRRIEVDYSKSFIVLFVLLRIACFLAAASYLSILWTAELYIAYSALIALMILHNALGAMELRFVTFIQMSAMRFAVPVFVLVAPGNFLRIFAVAVLFFAYSRFITYQDSKGRLRIPERKHPHYLFLANCLFVPTAAAISFLERDFVLLYLNAYYMAMYLAYWLVSRQRGTSISPVSHD